MCKGIDIHTIKLRTELISDLGLHFYTSVNQWVS